MYHVTKALIDTGAIRHNIETIRTHIDKKDKNVRIIAVIKADAYGHDVKICAPLLYSLGIRDFAVSNLDEALEVRELVGRDATVLILGYTMPCYAQIMSENSITQTVFSLGYARELCEYLKDSLNVHIKIDTGMNRLGFSPDDKGIKEIEEALTDKKLTANGIFTHFACADEEESAPTIEQYGKFTGVIGALAKDGIDFETKHVCNSAGVVSFPDMYMNAVRCGIIIYGLQPSADVPDIGLLPAMRVVSRISHIHTLKKGEKISYGGTFTAPHDIQVATVSIGYADGFIRSYATGGLYINNHYAKLLGRICMDQCMVDISDIDCAPGDEVEIFGKNQSAEDFARHAHSIGYETTCLIGKRVTREEVKDN